MDGGGLGSCQRPRVRVRRRGDTPGRARREGGVSSCCGRGAAHSTRTPPAVVPSTHHSETTINHQHHSPHGRAGSAPARADSLFFRHGVTRGSQNLMRRVHSRSPPTPRADTRP